MAHRLVVVKTEPCKGGKSLAQGIALGSGEKKDCGLQVRDITNITLSLG